MTFWILIIFFQTGYGRYGGGVATQTFRSLSSCENAVNKIQQASFAGIIKAVCVEDSMPKKVVEKGEMKNQK